MDVPADGFAEIYRVTLSGAGGQSAAETSDRSLTLAVAGLPAVAGQPLTIAVEMLGPFAASRAVTTTLII